MNSICVDLGCSPSPGFEEIREVIAGEGLRFAKELERLQKEKGTRVKLVHKMLAEATKLFGELEIEPSNDVREEFNLNGNINNYILLTFLFSLPHLMLRL